MASSGAALWLFCLFLSFTAVATEENITSHVFNTTAFGDHNVTYDVTNSYSTQPTGFESITTTPSHTNTEPLPVSGRLLTPVTGGNLSLAAIMFTS